ncbi:MULTISPECIES: carbon starvation protein A [Thermococcus]|uniref:Carbon starvation protein, predicted membrane protein n=1 Tax=Thermococcus nautili TaxID=195522 RepID=W8NTK7_9EURY|nr:MULTISPECIES: carbon starvation protein A [Thermococcus]AHL22462.1 Carbon starvation protein, predicted membrane protein [Thermococcus nautili]NJE48290.1 carbon starvation protein A [Thermococcus sp. 9N3]CAI1493491.1 Carbon starvation protein, predicted membrane protein [Thermococcus nautili]
MNSAVIILLAGAIYLGMYFTYGKALQNKVVKADPNRPTPAHRLYDGVDYVPANPLVLYGHHFASIAGAGPIVGPAVAMAWGWLPGLLWVWFGNVFIGAVHDYLALMSSVRYDGKSVQWIAGKLMSKRTGVAFEVYIWFALLLVVAAFVAVTAKLLTITPQAATATLLFLVVAVILGYLLYKVKIDFKVATLIGIGLLIVAVWLGLKYPLVFVEGQTDTTSAAYTTAYHYWNIILMVYIIIAASLPVWILLQPRDYLNAYVLWFGLIFGGVAFILLAKNFTAPAFTSWSAHVVKGITSEGTKAVPSPFWPTIPLIIACGSLSGFHSLVGSGTTSKQLDNELHGLMVGYGGMFTEGFLATIVITAIAVYGVGLTGIPADKWATEYITKGGLGTFIGGYAKGVHDFYGVSETFGKTFATLWVSAFTLTSLDTATRLGRFAWQELFGMVTDTSKGIAKTLTNKWVASIIIAGLGTYLAWGAGYKVIWPAFSAMNQMLASIAMMTAALWVAKVQRAGKWSWAVLIPALFLWITVTAAIIWYLIYVPMVGQYLIAVKGALVVSLVLNLLLAWDFWVAWKRPTEEYTASAA